MDRCALCPGVHRFVSPIGPLQSDYMFIGEAPGRDEDRKGEPFIGKTGREFNEGYLPTTGLKRANCYITNSIKCLPNTPKHKLDIKRKDHLALLESCTHSHLYNEIARVQPKLLIPLGAFACYAIDPDINLELHHGIPIQTRFGIPAFPMYHPALGIHEPKKMITIRTDWIRLRWYLKGVLNLPVDEFPNPDYREAAMRDIGEIDPNKDMACDTEYSRNLGPYVLTYSQIPGEARLIRASRKDLLQAFQTKLDKWSAYIVFHNWLYDWNVTEDMGLSFPFNKIRDTMLMAFHLGNLPLRLKVLAYRELGMVMQDIDDLVKPYSSSLVLDYYRSAYLLDWPKPDESIVRKKEGMWKVHKPQSIKTKLKRFFTDYEKSQESKDVFDIWDNWEDQQTEIEEKCGPWPGKDIAHVPFDEMLYYACRDAHATLLLYYVLKKMRTKTRKVPQELWR